MSKRLKILLLDNGSVRAEAVLLLRQLASKLSHRCGHSVDAVSLRHANRIDADELNGVPAATFSQYLAQQHKIEPTRFIVIPLFFSLNDALTRYVPEQLEQLQSNHGEIDISFSEVVYPLPHGEAGLVSILQDHIVDLSAHRSDDNCEIVLVDHGSPSSEVTAVRRHIAQSLIACNQGKVIGEAVMERREGSLYDFNGPLLEHYLAEKSSSGVKRVIVLLLFFLPGRHAGKDGDIVEICDRVMRNHSGLDVQVSPLVAEHERLIDILLERISSLVEISSDN